MHTVRTTTGRLVEAQVVSLTTDADVDAMLTDVRINVIAQPKVVLIGEITRVGVLPQAHTEKITTLFTRDNPRVERSAFLVGKKRGSFAMQMERMIRDAGNPARKLFDDPRDLYAHLDPVLDPGERARLREFLERAVREVIA